MSILIVDDEQDIRELIGDILRAKAPAEAATAYRKALAVAQAAGLDAITMIAAQASQDIGMQK